MRLPHQWSNLPTSIAFFFSFWLEKNHSLYREIFFKKEKKNGGERLIDLYTIIVDGCVWMGAQRQSRLEQITLVGALWWKDGDNKTAYQH